MQAQGSHGNSPPSPQRGKSVFVYVKDFRAWAKRNTIKPGKGLYSTQTANGRTLNVKNKYTQVVDGFEIYLRDGTRFHVSLRNAMAGYDAEIHDDWSLEFAVTNSRLDDYADDGETPPVMTNPIGTSAMDDGATPPTDGTELFDGDASAVDGVGDPAPIAQTYFRIPIIRDKRRISYGGVYRENIRCVGSRGPIVELLRAG